MFTINFVDTNQKAIDEGTESDSRQNNLVASLAMVPQSQGGPALFVSFGGGVRAFVAAVRSLVLDRGAAVRGCGERRCIGGDATSSSTVPTRAAISAASFAFEARADPTAPRQGIQPRRSPRTPVSRPTCCASKASLTPKAAQFRLQMLGAIATLSPDSFDNFIAKILPKDGLRVNFDVGVGLRESTAAAFFEGQIRSAGTGGTSAADDTAAARRATAAAAAVAARDRTRASD